MDGKELFLMIEAISNEKNITKEDVLESLEEALAVATKKRNNIEVRVEVDRHSGEFKTFRQWQVIEDGEDFVDDDGTMFDPELHIYQAWYMCSSGSNIVPSSSTKSSPSSITCHCLKVLNSPECLSTSTRTSILFRFFVATANASSNDSRTSSFVMFFSFEIASIIKNNSLPSIGFS